MASAWALDIDYVRNQGAWVDGDGVRRRNDIPNVLQVPLEIKTISEAMAQAHSGDVIAISPGEYCESLMVQKSITFKLEIPPFLPLEACRTVTIIGVNGAAAMRIHPPDSDGRKTEKVVVSCFDIIFQSHSRTLMDHAIEVEACTLNLESCETVGGTHGLFAYNKAVVHARSSTFRDAARSGISLASGANGVFQFCRMHDNAEEGLCVCGWNAIHNPSGTRALVEACFVERNRSFGLHVYGGGELRARGADVRFNGQSGVHVLHRDTVCALDSCRVSDNEWFGVFVQKLNGEVPEAVTVAHTLLRRNGQGPARAHPGCPLAATACRGLDDSEGDAAGPAAPPPPRRAGRRDDPDDPDDEGDEALVKDWLTNMGQAALVPHFRAVNIVRLVDARALSLTDLQAMGINDLYTRRLLLMRLRRDAGGGGGDDSDAMAL